MNRPGTQGEHDIQVLAGRSPADGAGAGREEPTDRVAPPEDDITGTVPVADGGTQPGTPVTGPVPGVRDPTASVPPVDAPTAVVPPVPEVRDPTASVPPVDIGTDVVPVVEDTTLVAGGMVGPDATVVELAPLTSWPEAVIEAPPSAAERKARRARFDRRIRLVALGFTYVCIVIVLFLGYLFGFTALQQARHQEILVSNVSGPSGQAARDAKVPAEGQPLATLKIPALHLDQIVVQGTSPQDLENGPGFMPGSAPLGVRGNSVIAGRRVTFGAPFGQLLTLQRGDVVEVTSGRGRFRYEVTRVGTAAPGQRDPVSPSTRAELTLVTYPPLVDQGRQYATARMTSKPASKPRFSIGRPHTELGLTGDWWALLPALLWGLVLFAVCLGTVLAYRRWTQTWTIYLLTTPVLIAVAVLCFQNVALLLPATF